MLFFKDGFTVYTKGKQTLIAIGVCLVIGGAIFFGVRSYIHMMRERDAATFDKDQLQVKFKILENNLAQAQNNPPLSKEKLRELLGEEYRAVLDKHKQEVLAVVQAEFKLHGSGGGSGQSNGDSNTPPTEYSYPKKGAVDPIMKSIVVDVRKPLEPKFTYDLNNISIELAGTLNFDIDKKGGKGSFWMQPSLKGAPKGLEITTTRAELTPSDSFQAYLESVRTGSAAYPVPAKWTGSLMVGKEFAKEFIGGQRIVYGADLMRNWSNGLGAGGGVLGSTFYIKAGYSWGK